MELMDICGVTSTGDTNQRVDTRSKALHKRLGLRKTVVEPSTMQSEDKSGPKKIADERASSKSSQEVERSPETLRFACSKCRDGLEYAPKDLARHFEDMHKGSPPVFPCPTCTFNTHEFSSLQVHLLSHTDTFPSCCICKDDVRRTWSEFSAHLSVRHCRSGKYFCEICPAFSTGEVRAFLEHVCVHDGAAGDLRLRCQHCDYQAAQKRLISKHIKAVHVCPGGNERKKKKEVVNSIVVKPNDPIPKMKPRLTRSAVREMCWLTQDCLSLPGREFLDKYCHLSDPQTTLEEAQQLLVRSVARETGDPKWTNALKTVLSNVPQDAGLHPKSENGLVLNTDLTVLTVKNKITVAPNGASYSRRLKRATPSDREAALDGSAAAADQTGCQASLSDLALCTQADTKSHNDITALAPDEAFECAPMQENRENRELETLGERGKRQEATDEDRSHLTSEPQLANEHEVQPSVRKVPPRKKKRRSQRWKRKTRFRRVDKSSPALKIVLKKNPVKGKQWVSQSSLSTSGDLCKTVGKTMKVSQNASSTEAQTPEVDLPDTSGALTSVSQLKPGVELGSSCAAKPAGSTGGPVSEHDGTHGGAETSPRFSAVVNRRSPGGKTGRSDSRPAAETCCEPAGAQTGSSEDGETKSPPVCQPVITSQGHLDGGSLGLSIEQNNEMREYENLISTCSPVGKAIGQESSPASGCDWQPAPKTLERTLKLIAINPSQLVKRPSGGQPVVVLNHPDADVPEVARIMEVINRYRGEVQKVVLSRRTLRVLSAANGEAPPDSGGRGENSVQERFVLKMRLRRLSRKKYEVVGGAASPSGNAAPRFRCWFCGRVFDSREVWMVHRRRHLME